MGGDYYDWALGEDGLRLVLADVSGKGAAAAMLMAAVRALVRSRWSEADLARASRLVSRAVFDNVPASRYATAFLARLDPPTGRLRFVNAGHQPALIVRADGTAQALASSGVPLGLMESASYTAADATLGPGDALLIFSDGVSEARDAAGQELGVDRLLELMRGGLHLDAAGLVEKIEHALDAFSAGAPVDDDRTLLVLKRVDPARA
jgi:sigma-B regulation protein RsbU (phosphoserine phosphatase)